MIDYIIYGIYYSISTVILLNIVLWVWKELSMGICHHEDSLNGKLIVITGGNNGIGFETSLDLVKRGAKVIIGCRKTQNVVTIIKSSVPGADVEVLKLDLSSNKSIRNFADEIKSKYGVIDILINNAGMVSEEKKESEDGFELVMATNYLGHALLNHLLLDLVKRAGIANKDFSRIILVSSLASADKNAVKDLCKTGQDNTYDINFGVQNMKNMQDPYRQYGKSKLAQIMYGKHLSKLLLEENCNTMVSSLHPGFVRTGIFQGFPKERQMFIKLASYVLGKTPLQGAQTTLHLALSNFSDEDRKLLGGKFFCDCRSKNLVNAFMPKVIDDPVACKSIWDETMKALEI